MRIYLKNLNGPSLVIQKSISLRLKMIIDNLNHEQVRVARGQKMNLKIKALHDKEISIEEYISK